MTITIDWRDPAVGAFLETVIPFVCLAYLLALPWVLWRVWRAR